MHVLCIDPVYTRWSWTEWRWLQTAWWNLPWLRSVLGRRSVREGLAGLVLLVGVEAGLGHDGVGDGDVDVVGGHVFHASAEGPVVDELLEGVDLLVPLLLEQRTVDFCLIVFKTMLLEILPLHNLLRSSDVVIWIIRVQIL